MASKNLYPVTVLVEGPVLFVVTLDRNKGMFNHHRLNRYPS